MPVKALADIKNTAFLGGLGTGCLKLTRDMTTEFAGLVKSSSKQYSDKTPVNVNPVSFIAGVKFDGEDKFKAAALGSFENTLPSVSAAFFEQSFPFVKVSFSGKKIKGIEISMSAFSPCIIHNPIDSAIPAAFFDFEIKNTSDKNALVSLCTVMKSFFSAGKSAFGYEPVSGTSYVAISEASRSVAARRRGSLCIATDCTDFTYETDRDESLSYFYKRFCGCDGFLSDNAQIGSDAGVKNISAMLASHLRVEAGKSAFVRIIAAWCFPYCGDGAITNAERNYYCHYFPDILSCATYCVAHFDRLKKESSLLGEYIYGANMPENVKKTIGTYMGTVKSPYILRDSGGVLYGVPECSSESCISPYSALIEFLFPGITHSSAVCAMKKLIYARGKSPDSGEFMPSAYDTDCTPGQIYARLMLILRLYRYYRCSSELKFFSENWVDIAYMADVLCRTALHCSMETEDIVRVYPAVICTMKAMMDVAEVLADKKRKMYYLDLYSCARTYLKNFASENIAKIAPQILKGQYLASICCGMHIYDGETTAKAAESVDVLSPAVDFFVCAALESCGFREKCEKAAEAIHTKKIASAEYELLENAVQCGALIPVFSGFDYDKNSMTISFAPDDSLCDADKTFRGFISFDSAYGYVEQGIDYIEIILLSGEIKVKKFICSHKPYKAMYGGRMWNCDIDGNTVTLDSNLSVTKEKKLTLLIDITK